MKVKVFLATFIILGLSYTIFHAFIKDLPSPISEAEARAAVVELYGGKVLAASHQDGQYQMTLENGKGVYHLDVDEHTKQISGMKLVEKKETLQTIDEAKKKIEQEFGGTVSRIHAEEKDGQKLAVAKVEKELKSYDVEYNLVSNEIAAVSEGNKGQHSAAISEQKAKEIALQKVNGQVTNISNLTLQNGQHYKVTVDNQAETVHMYIQANTGNISSLSSISKADDDDDDDDDDGHEDEDDDDVKP